MNGQIPAERPSGMRWVMIGLAFLATVLNYVHRLAFNYRFRPEE